MMQREFDFEQHKKELDAFRVAQRNLLVLSSMLTPCMDASVLDELTELMTMSPNHAAMVAHLSTYLTDKAIEELWLRILHETESHDAKRWTLNLLGWRASTDVLPGLLAFLDKAEGDQEIKTLTVVSHIIASPTEEASPFGPKFKPSNDANYGPSQKAAIRLAVSELLDKTLAAGPQDDRSRGSSISSWPSIFHMAFEVNTPDIIPRMTEGVSTGVWKFAEVLSAAHRIPKDEAVSLCLALLEDCDEFELIRIFSALGDIGSPRALPHLREYLNDTTPTKANGLRVCDHVCLAMEEILGIRGRDIYMPFDDESEREEFLKDFDARRAEMLERTKDLAP